MSGLIPQDDEEMDQVEGLMADEDFFHNIEDNGEASPLMSEEERRKFQEKRALISGFLQKLNTQQINKLRDIPPPSSSPPPPHRFVNDPTKTLQYQGRVGKKNPKTPSEADLSEGESGDGGVLQLENDEQFSEMAHDEDRRSPPPPRSSHHRSRGDQETGGKRDRSTSHKKSSGKNKFFPSKSQNTGKNQPSSSKSMLPPPIPPPPTPVHQQQGSLVSVNVSGLTPTQGDTPQATGNTTNNAYTNNFSSYQAVIPAAGEERIIPILLHAIGSYMKDRGETDNIGYDSCHWWNNPENTPCHNRKKRDEKLQKEYCVDAGGRKHWHLCRTCLCVLHTPHPHKMRNCAIWQFLKAHNIEPF